jgi:starch phosphorylase
MENEYADKTPETFIFGAKSAPGYHMAKMIIKLINNVAQVINNDTRVNDILKVVFVENYSVSLAEKIVAAADVSEQISTASKEASGTGNMKLMMNGALTVGTLVGANVEIAERVGRDNIYIFGLTAQEVLNLYARGNDISGKVYQENRIIRSVVDTLIDGTFNLGRDNLFNDIYHSIVFGSGFPDQYFILADFESYLGACTQIFEDYRDEPKWRKKAIINTAKSGFFSSDRTIREYNDKIWRLTD